MIPSTFSLISSNIIYQYPRRMLLHSPFFHHRVQPTTATPPPPSEHQAYTTVPPKHGGSSMDANVVMIFSVLLCLLIFSICINCLIRCMFKCLIMITTRNTQERSLRDNKVIISSGLDKRALKTFPVVKYSKDVKVQGLGTECVICLADFKGGEKLRILPKCHHGFHVKCIDKWLGSQSSCPICRQSLVDTCQKIIDCDHAHNHQATSSSSSSLSSPSEVVVISIVPLEREGLVRD
ncbi:RING-H2 finger protein ATL73-like [Chenopodium quinoa]|uniref:RING-H2 finger protein ATL73-like n=1 Tax=Chenopodium quinoa TaxID=63459 RepID=UPI000B797CF2|nr:RING-H2 finger protein ATL73-like [Chenopodium quinoa]